MRESTIEQHFVKCTVSRGWETRKVQWIGVRGAPDRILMAPPRRSRYGLQLHHETVWIEFKAPGVKPESYQLREHERMRAAGQDVRVIDSIEGVDALFKELE